MKNKIFVIIPILLIAFGSCETNEQPTYRFHMYPRVCNYVYLFCGCKSSVYFEKKFVKYEYRLFSRIDTNLPADSFALNILSQNVNVDSINRVDNYNYNEIDTKLSTPIKALEEQLKSSYIKYSSQFKYSNLSVTPSPINIEYRTSGIKKLNILALDAVLFGKDPETSLNDYFEIGEYEPSFLASYETERLIYGFYDKNMPTSIDEWLYNKPFIQPEMYLSFKTIPTNLPLRTRFVVQIELDNGNQLSDTTAQITITK